MSGQVSMFDVMFPDFKIDKPIRLIELFAGVGSQAMALRNIGADFEHYKISEWEVSATASYKAIHMENDNTDYSLEIEIAKLPKILFDYGISKDGKKPMTLEEIERKGEKWQRITYNNLRATNNLGSICNFKGEDLEIVDTDNFTYLLTYSFPCQDLSVAGKRKGMSKDSGTRSGLLWEVERLLNEVENLPQVLLMENVPQVISDANIKDFQLWQQFLEDKGYSNYTEILNAKDYGVAQNRERCFMVSLLGEWNYKFPKPIPLTKTMKDYLEDEVDERYYINSEKAQKLIQQLMESGQLKDNRQYADGTINEPKTKDISNCLTARQDRGISNQRSEGGVVVECKI
jgi:DNA (cytosine-5)-methyltransferase 1